MEEIAERAGVSKGTLYLYFPTKEALFEEVMRANVLSVIEAAAAALGADGDMPAPVQLRFLLERMYRDLVGTERRRLLHLMIAEGPHFPAIAEFYHREVISRGMALLRMLIERGVARGEFTAHGLDEQPMIVIAPALLAGLYTHLFAEREPIDLESYCRTHVAAVLRMLGADEGSGGR
jgi:AcrR family transcriptional regulator